MKFTPEKYSLPDERMVPFIDPSEIWDILNRTIPSKEKVRKIIAKSLSNTERVRNVRKIIYELMLSDHNKECLSCWRNQNCELQ